LPLPLVAAFNGTEGGDGGSIHGWVAGGGWRRREYDGMRSDEVMMHIDGGG